MDYQLISEHPVFWCLSAVLSLALTALIYGAGPLLFCRLRNRPISAKRYLIFCVLYAASVYLSLTVLYVFIAEGVPNMTAAFLWTVVFYKYGKQKLPQAILPAIPVAAPQPQEESPAEPVPAKPVIHKKSRFIVVPVLAVLCILLTVALAAVSWSYHSYIGEAEASAADASRQITHWKTTCESYKNLASRRGSEIEYLEEKAKFFDEKIVIVLEEGYLYHKYDCEFFQDFYDGTYWLLTKEVAEDLGYESGCDCTLSSIGKLKKYVG